MTVDELLMELQQLADTGYGDCAVRLAFQHSWPLAFEVAGVVPLAGDDEEVDDPDPEPEPDETVVWLVEGGHPDRGSPYAPRSVFERV